MPISRFSDCVVVPLPQEEKKVTPPAPKMHCTRSSSSSDAHNHDRSPILSLCSLSLSLLLHNPIKCFPLDISTCHSTPHIPLKPIPIAH